jgi:hypothetical protein
MYTCTVIFGDITDAYPGGQLFVLFVHTGISSIYEKDSVMYKIVIHDSIVLTL